MGLGGAPSEWDDYEWVRLSDLRVADLRLADVDGRRRGAGRTGGEATEPLADALCAWFERNRLWSRGEGPRVLLVDLDNLRADPARWRARMAVVVSLARGADHVILAGQGGAVVRARPYLAEFAGKALAVPDGGNLADYVLLDAAGKIYSGDRVAHSGRGRDVQVVVLSNDGIFASLAERGPIAVISPGCDALSDRLRDAAARVVDLTALEEAASEQFSRRRRAAKLERSAGIGRGPTARGRRGRNRYVSPPMSLA